MPRDIAEEARVRKARCKQIAELLVSQGFDVTWEKVNRQYPLFDRWFNRRLATGYLIHNTGIKRFSERKH